MICLMCQNIIQRKTLEDYIKKLRVCAHCASLNYIPFEVSSVPYHHVTLTLYYSGLLKDTYLDARIMQEMIHKPSHFLAFTHDTHLDACVLALYMDVQLYLNSYLTLDTLSYIQSLEASPVLLIHG